MKDEVLISQGNRPFWQSIIAALSFTVVFTAIFLFFYNFDTTSEKGYFKEGATYLEIAIYALGPAIFYSIKQNYYFDFKNNLYKHEYTIIFYRRGRWKPLPALEYISVFKKDVQLYEVNLWYAGNKHFKIYRLENEDQAMQIGKQLATTLQIDLLDATVAHDSKWIDL